MLTTNLSIGPTPGRIVFVTGGSGFVGAAVIDDLVARGFKVHALVNRKSVADRGGYVTSFAGGLDDTAAIDTAIAGCVAVIHLVGIIVEKPAAKITFDRIHYEGTRTIVDATRRAGIRRYIQMSALGTREGAVAEYHRSKWKAEQYVRASGLDYTILRPSMIHGPGGQFTQMEADWARGRKLPFLFMPYFGAGAFGTGGAGKLQPVFVKDCARAFVDCIDNAKTIGQTYGLGGSEVVTWPQMHRKNALALAGKTKPVLAIPAWYAKLIAGVLPASLLPFNASQVQMSQEDNTTDLAPFVRDFGWTPQGFSAALDGYAKRV